MIKAVVLDMDGVLYHGTRRLEGALEFLAWLPVPYAFITNNSSRTPTQVANKLANMGIDVAMNQIMTSSLATAAYLQRHYAVSTPIYAIGEVGLMTALQQAGFVLTTDAPEIVVVGLDREFNDEKLQTAVRALHNGAVFIGTNMDRILMTENGPSPGTGTIIMKVADAAQRTPLVMGKPERQIFEMAATYLGVKVSDMLMVGDNVDTDIAGANQNNLYAALVLTGVSTQDDLNTAGCHANYIASNLNILREQIATDLSY